MVKNYKVKESSKEDKERVRKMEVILLLRKGKALIDQNNIQKAIEQYESALDISPDNETIKNDLEKLKNSI